MARKPLTIEETFGRDNLAKYIAHTWHRHNTDRQPVIDRWKELRNYIFATDTTTTTNKSLPWKNSTTLPKLCQIRDNLHSNYISALFPNQDWFKWEGYSLQDAIAQKAKAIKAYIGTKTRESDFVSEISKLVYDYIDYGNSFATVVYENSFILDDQGQRVPTYTGPKVVRISPYDIVFNPIADSFKDSYKIIRKIRTKGELYAMAQEQPDNVRMLEALKKREKMISYAQGYGIEEEAKAEGILIDGFGNYNEYLQGEYVELLTFYGDIFDSTTRELRKGREITVIDRMWVIEDKAIPSWMGQAPIYHCGWRNRPDNLWAMGPLENLVGLQYRIDHLENLKADAMDLAILPPLVIKGEVEEFVYGPNEEIHIDENGDVTELARNVQWVIQADNAIAMIEQRMEQYAGAPREAMGIRTAGEKTAFEVQQLMTAAGRIFQEKTETFERDFLEKILNAMFETAKRNLDIVDVATVMDDDLGVTQFMEITKEDITASGKLRPIGARHFAAQAQLVQNLTNLANTPIWQQIGAHTSSKKLAQLVEEVFGLHKYSLFSPNVAIAEQQETQSLMNQAGEDLEVQNSTPPLESL